MEATQIATTIILLIVTALIVTGQTVICFRQQDLFGEIEQLNKKVTDLEEKIQSQPKTEFSYQKVAESVAKSMCDIFREAE